MNPEKRLASLAASKRTPEARAHQTELNHARWARPGEREKLSEQNRQRWADPAIKTKLSEAISAGWSEEKRRAFADFRRRQWAEDVAYRAKNLAAMRRSKSTPEARALFSALLTARWRDPVLRARYTAGIQRNLKRPEVRLKISVATQRRWDNDPVWREKILAVLAANVNRAERRRKELRKIDVVVRDATVIARAPVSALMRLDASKQPLMFKGPQPKNARPVRLPTADDIARFIAERGVTRLPAAAVEETTAVISADDQRVLAAYQARKEEERQNEIMERVARAQRNRRAA